MDYFEESLCTCRNALERFVYYKIRSRADGDDILQEIYLTAYQKYDTLKEKALFRSWILTIARNKVNDYYRQRARLLEIPLDALMEKRLTYGRRGVTESSFVRETLEVLGGRDREILYLYFFRELSQAEISRRLNIPVGTVKSRLYTAKQRFQEQYPYAPKTNERLIIMKKLPDNLPEYTITKSQQKPFSVKWEELTGWFLVPKLGEKLSWGMYDLPSGKCSHTYEMEVTGRAEVHGVEGVELTAREFPFPDRKETMCYTFVAQLTDSHCRYLAATRTENGLKKYTTFLDEDDFMPNWGFGEHNCGNKIHLTAQGDITRRDKEISSKQKPFLLDIVGRYSVTIGGKQFDTVCVMDIETYNPGVVSEQYLDKTGRTVLWRRFNRDDWAMERYGKRWSQALPENERILINGVTYVHWYDCITDYIL